MIQQALSKNFAHTQPISLSEHICPNCGNQGLSLFYEVHNVPVHSCLMMSTEEEALDFPCGDVVLGFCEDCGFITNVSFDPRWSAYAPNYEDQQSFSPTFNQFALDLANHLIDKYDLHNKDIIEIGCSKGDFLLLLCELGNNRGVGIDPSAVVGRVHSEAADRVTFIQDYYSERYAEYVGDFICCRHTLEHIYPTAEFISTVRRSIGDRLNTVVVFEIPDTIRVLKDLAFEDIYYEHCSYFTPGSLARLFRNCGFEVTDLYRAYGEQYLLIETRPVTIPSEKVHPLEESLEEVTQHVKNFTNEISKKLENWKQHLEQIHAQGKRVVVWGSGSKCVAFLTTLDTTDKIEYVVDINPHRHGKFIPGVGKKIMAPEFLKQYKPDQVIVMNSIYCDEIQQMLDKMGVTTEVISL
ncbi:MULTISPECIES: class I SAM-dependent methyltransferase [Moorena]|uniref:C-methyltransferase n=1 Tax=Moorena producens 3L TaxID=489825 RepID=F4XPU4_9CYAN|nr:MULTISPECIES: class I SAM-dependent methyltransferase [Moorena]EGJ33311.1 C-methyltransferase [Moorena producens 3L]NEP31428.1 methyltransferase domain-containing protein [Moorena sp. SIO3B2]NEP66463.1 methyltransferase domain-containing protein [Moorena sp. SIO3A5]OLT63727.1 SAM-dependent methyltransferase [Moorena producens 3L]